MRTIARPWIFCVALTAACADNSASPDVPLTCEDCPGDSGPDVAKDQSSFDGPSFDIPDGARPIDGTVSDGANTDGASTDGASTDASSGDVAAPVDAGPPPCPLYQARCGGVCVPVSVDPTNCGSCGTVCPTGRVCVGGACGATCPGGLTACAGACVDTQSNSAHCGACGMACAAGTGCVAGHCERAVFVDPSGARCEGGGPSVDLGGGRCAGTVAETSFRWAICSCTDLSMTTPLTTDGFDSTRGGYTPGSVGAGVGTNRAFSNTNTTDIGGALWVGSSNPWTISAPQRVRQFLKVNASVTPNNMLTVDEDAYVRGDLRPTVPVTITGALHIPPDAGINDMVTYRRLLREPVTVAPPCDCDPATFVPIAALVAEGRTRNDNARIGLDSEALVTPGTNRRVDLPCGRYYFSSIGNPGAVTIVAHGRVALFIGGNIDVTGPLTITLDANAELDLIVGGSFRASTPVNLGSPAYPALTRVYIGGADGFRATGTTTLGGNFYVPLGPVDITTPLEVFGGVFAGSFRATNTVAIHYDRGVLRAGDTCRNPPPPPVTDAGVPDAGPPDAGTPDAGMPRCTSCRDCANQACNGGTCGACMGDSDCCAPLQCWMGRCVIIPG